LLKFVAFDHVDDCYLVTIGDVVLETKVLFSTRGTSRTEKKALVSSHEVLVLNVWSWSWSWS